MRTELKPEIKQSCFDFAKQPTAAGLTWKDETSYSRDDRERIPVIFKTKVGICTITIIVGHIYHPNTWVMNCYELGIKEKELQCITAKEAAQLAVGYSKEKVQNLYDAFSVCE